MRCERAHCDRYTVPHRLNLQWHITQRCNLRCEHCYQDRDQPQSELTLSALYDIFDQYLRLLRRLRARADHPVGGQITLTGGEPFIREDFFELLRHITQYTNRGVLRFAILTNGTLVTDGVAQRLAAMSPAYIQVSMEGGRATHDHIRGAGNFDRTLGAIEALADAGIRTIVSFTAHRGNYREFPNVVSVARRHGAAKVWADRLLPVGAGSALSDAVLSPAETKEFFTIMARERRRCARRPFSHTTVQLQRALQFLVGGGRPYRCNAGDGLVTIMPDGELYPCRRLPIGVGNVRSTPLDELYFSSELLVALRQRGRVSNGCEQCFYRHLCRGGLRCLAYAVTGDPFRADPGCWRAGYAHAHDVDPLGHSLGIYDDSAPRCETIAGSSSIRSMYSDRKRDELCGAIPSKKE